MLRLGGGFEKRPAITAIGTMRGTPRAKRPRGGCFGKRVLTIDRCSRSGRRRMPVIPRARHRFASMAGPAMTAEPSPCPIAEQQE
jgi:hypothetical protein